jgi:hypothetical protein
MICDCRRRHRLPSLAAAFAFLMLAAPSTAHASRSCLDSADAAPSQPLVQDGVGCWASDHHLPRAEAPSAVRETIIVTDDPAFPDPPPDFLLDDEEAATTMHQFVLLVSVVLATASGFVACRPDNSTWHRTPVHKSW